MPAQPNEHLAGMAVAKGVRARELLENPTLTEAFEALEAAYMLAWRGTTVDDVAAREKLFLAVNIIGKVKTHLQRVVENGKLGEAELRQIAQAAERQRGWHEVK